MNEFLQELHKLSKKCQFVNVTAKQLNNLFKTFINRLMSNIRQRQLESQILKLSQACETARVLEHPNTTLNIMPEQIYR